MDEKNINFKKEIPQKKRLEYLDKNDKLAEKILEDIGEVEKQRNNREEPDELNENDNKAEQIYSAIENSTDFSEQRKLLQQLWNIYDKAKKPLQKTTYQESKDLLKDLNELINNLNNSKKIKYKKRIEKIVAKPKKEIEEMRKTNKILWRILRQVRNDLIAVPDLKKEKGEKELRGKIKNVHNDILNIISKNFKVKALKQRANDINERLNKDIDVKDLEDILSEMVLIRTDINEIISKSKHKKEKENEKKSSKVEIEAQADDKIIDKTLLTDKEISELYDNAKRNLKWLNRQGASWLDYKTSAEDILGNGASQEQVQQKAEELRQNDIEYYSKIIKAIESNNIEEVKKLNDESKIKNETLDDLEIQIRDVKNEILDLEEEIKDVKNEIKQTKEKLSKIDIECDDLKTKGFNPPEKAKKELIDYLNVLKNHLQELQNHLQELNEKVGKENFIGEKKMKTKIGNDYQRIKEMLEQHFANDDKKQEFLKEAQDLFETSKQAKTRSQLDKIFRRLRAIRNDLFVEFTKEQQKKVEKDINKMPEKEKEKLKISMLNLGFFIEKNKNDFFHKIFKKTSKIVNEKSGVGQFLKELSLGYLEDKEKVKKEIKKIEKGEKHRFKNFSYLTGNILRYGRVITDFIGYSISSPYRYVMMSGMFFSRATKAIKQARLKNEKVLEKTRIKDIDKAAEEAWKIYEQAKNDKENVSKEDLEKIYQQNIPKDLLKRLSKNPEPGTASNLLQKIIKKDLTLSVKNIDKKIVKIEQDKNLSEEKRKRKKEKILKKYSKHLNDLDGIVSQYGTIDTLAMGAKYGQFASDATVKIMMIETAGMAIYKVWENLPHILSSIEKVNSKGEKEIIKFIENIKNKHNLGHHYKNALKLSDKELSEIIKKHFENSKFSGQNPKGISKTELNEIIKEHFKNRGQVLDFNHANKAAMAPPVNGGKNGANMSIVAEKSAQPQPKVHPSAEIEKIWQDKVNKGDSPLKIAKNIYKEHAQNLGYKGDIKNKIELNKWAEKASARHIVGQYIREHSNEYSDLIKHIGEPPKDPTRLDNWLHKVPKGTFDKILNKEVPNLVFKGDTIEVGQTGNISAFDSSHSLRTGHINIAKKIIPKLDINIKSTTDIAQKQELLNIMRIANSTDHGMHPIKLEEVKKMGINIYDKDGLSNEDIKEILFLKQHPEVINKPKLFNELRDFTIAGKEYINKKFTLSDSLKFFKHHELFKNNLDVLKTNNQWDKNQIEILQHLKGDDEKKISALKFVKNIKGKIKFKITLAKLKINSDDKEALGELKKLLKIDNIKNVHWGNDGNSLIARINRHFWFDKDKIIFSKKTNSIYDLRD